MLKISILLLCGVALSAANPFGTLQSAAAAGRVFCNGKPASGVLIKLYDKDTFDLDDLMAEVKSDANGVFRISGSEKEVTKIDPQINFYTTCGMTVPLCTRKFSVTIPDSHITRGAIPQQWFNLGDIELNGKRSGETIDCIH